MEMIVLKSCLSVFKEIYDLFKDLKELRDTSKNEFISWIKELAELIDNIANKIEKKEFPHDSCAHLEMMIDSFEKILFEKQYLSDSKYAKVLVDLKNVKEIERLYGEINNSVPDERESHIISLKQAAGTLRGLASLIRYTD